MIAHPYSYMRHGVTLVSVVRPDAYLSEPDKSYLWTSNLRLAELVSS